MIYVYDVLVNLNEDLYDFYDWDDKDNLSHVRRTPIFRVLKNVYFDNAELVNAKFFKTSLKDIDLSNSNIEGIATSIEDIKGAIIDKFQALDLLYLIGVKVKE